MVDSTTVVGLICTRPVDLEIVARDRTPSFRRWLIIAGAMRVSQVIPQRQLKKRA